MPARSAMPLKMRCTCSREQCSPFCEVNSALPPSSGRTLSHALIALVPFLAQRACANPATNYYVKANSATTGILPWSKPDKFRAFRDGDYSGNSTRSGCTLSRLCSSARTFPANEPVFLQRAYRRTVIRNSSPQPSHRRVPIS